MTTAVHWPVDDIDDALAADFDGSLSGLGIELGTASFNMRYQWLQILIDVYMLYDKLLQLVALRDSWWLNNDY